MIFTLLKALKVGFEDEEVNNFEDLMIQFNFQVG